MLSIRLLASAYILLSVALPGSAMAAAPAKFPVQLQLTGAGSVASSPSGITCPGTCAANFKQGTNITLTATPGTGESFVGWDGACSGASATCIVANIQAGVTVSAQFTSNGTGDGGSSTSTMEQLEARIAFLEASLAGLEEMLTGVNRGIDPNTNQDTLYFENMNVAIRNGSQVTDGFTNGRGNLILGYNEHTPWGLNAKTGSHNLIIGRGHTYSSSAGLVGGIFNTITGPFATVLGGGGNTASGQQAVVAGGRDNVASGFQAVVSGGYKNVSFGELATIASGDTNTATGLRSSVLAGVGNTASAQNATVSGGRGNTASGIYSTVSGGFINTASGQHATVSGGANNSATGLSSSIAGGVNNLSIAEYATVAGGAGNSANANWSSIAGGNSNRASGSYAAVAGGDFQDCTSNNATTCSEGMTTPVD